MMLWWYKWCRLGNTNIFLSKDSAATPAEKDPKQRKQRQSNSDPATVDCQVPYFMDEDGYVFSRDPSGEEPKCIGVLFA
jgi:hypothetical protein